MVNDLLLVVWVTGIGLLLGTGQTNGYGDLEEDFYFPKKYRKAGKLHKLMFKKQEYLRFSVFWTQKLILFNCVWYSLFLLLGNKNQFNLESKTYGWLAIILYFVMAFSTSLVDILIKLYIAIKKSRRK